MKSKIHIQTPEAKAADGLLDQLTSLVAKGGFDEVRVVSAYATVSGVRNLWDVFHKNPLVKGYWLLGLDDFVTQPGAIELLMSMKNSKVRVAELRGKGARFHPKFFFFRKSGKGHKGLVMVGSANLTAAGLSQNAEAVAFLQSTNAADAKDIKKAWTQLWNLGVCPDDQLLIDYAKKYKKNSSAQRKKQKGAEEAPLENKNKIEIFSHDAAEIDPSLAATCWIECGYVTARGRELEFKAEQSIFFGLKPRGGNPEEFKFKASNGDIALLRMKYQKNSMWRLQMNNNIPEVRAGLRKWKNEKQLRSPYVAVFKRTDESGLYDLSFIRLKSEEFQKLKKNTQKKGTYGRTTARSYGWL